MYSQAAGGALAELLYGPAAEYDATEQKYYYWDIWHKQGFNAWVRKGQTSPALFTNAGASNKHTEVWRSYVRSLGLSGGWLYITRSFWDGTKWVIQRCDIFDLINNKFHPCK